MSSNNDSPVPQPHPVEPSLPSSSDKNPQIDTAAALLRIIFRMDWRDWTLIAILISCLINHYFFTLLNVAQPIIDFTRLITALISAIFIAYKVVSGYKSKELITIFFKNHPLQLFVSIIACGATASFFLPLILNLFRFIGETDKLTTALLASTGGVIAVFTLIKTHQKNQNDEQTLDLDRKKYNQQIKDRMEDLKLQEAERLEQKEQFEKNLEAQSEKNKQDHTRQVHAERRSRYTKAVEQLANEKATVRLGGIYTLVGLVDEWLADDALNPEERQKEGQVIINNLCSYIRSPFTLALKAEMFEGDSEPDNYEGDFSKDQAAFHEEQNVRRTVFVEMSKRSSTFTRGLFGQITDTSQRMWSDFDFDFSRAPIFYPLNAITIEKGNFSGAKFYADANFFDAAFTQNADFSEAEFTQNADFSEAKFKGIASFGDSTFEKYSPLFVTTNDELGETYRAQFVALPIDQEAHDFTVSEGSFRIPPGEAELGDGVKHHIPVGTVLFDPSSGETSEPAKPLENSDTEEEKPTG